MSRPELLVVVTGTATEIGKTWVTAHVAAALRSAGLVVAARKPAQSYEEGAGPTDAEVLAAATGEAVDAVCPPERSYPLALAPPMAARSLGRPVPALAELAASISWPDGTDVGFVEGAGGPRSPIAGDGDNVHLAAALDPDLVLLVAGPGLGTINATVLSVAPFEGRPVLVAINRFDEDDALHRDNLAWLRDEASLDVVPAADVASRLMMMCAYQASHSEA